MKDKLLKKENMIVFALLGILLLVIAIPLDSGMDKKEINRDVEKEDDVNSESGKNEIFTDESMEYCLALESRIEELLASMEGVGKVEAMVTVSTSREMIVEKDEPISRSTVTETDGSGGSRSTNESNYEYETIFETDSEGNKTPYVIKQIEPQIQGITVVAQGGGNAVIQKNISDVLEALFHIEAHKIKVVKMK